jgi:AcrR family transcriptional regulator
MRRRAEQVDQTRQRIVEATVELHGSVGPASTTIAAVAEAAGVTRLTVYRHFPDEDALFGACSAHWISRQQLPDPGAWSRIGDPAARLRAGLADLYRFYRDGAGMLTCLYRDLAALPEEYQRALRDQDTLFGDILTAPFGSTSDDRRRLRAVTGHAISFWTWRSLCLDQGLTDAEAVDAMTGMVCATTPEPQAEPTQGSISQR